MGIAAESTLTQGKQFQPQAYIANELTTELIPGMDFLQRHNGDMNENSAGWEGQIWNTTYITILRINLT